MDWKELRMNIIMSQHVCESVVLVNLLHLFKTVVTFQLK